MVINYLKKDELLYELRLRGVAVSEEQTVAELRLCLRPLLKFEKADQTLHYPEYCFDPAVELKVIDEKVKELQLLLNDFTGDRSSSEFSRLNTRLVHLLKRNDRIPATSESSSTISVARSQFMVQILNLMEGLETKAANKEPGDVSNLFASMRLSDPAEDLLGGLSDDDSAASGAVANFSGVASGPVLSNRRYQPVDKWNLKFSGDTKRLSVHSFLERVSELCVARGVSEQQLFESAIDLFEGKALLWFRSNRTRFHDWKGLSRLLCSHYQLPDYKPRLLEEIMARTQDPSESIVEYLVCMNAMFRRYGKVSEDVQLGIIVRNLAPFYTMQLPSVSSLEQLEEECLKLEARKHRVDNFRPPTHQKRRDLVEPDFAFVDTTKLACSPASSVNEVQEFRSQIVGKCWNCLESGHLMRQCKSSRKKRCYQCGKANFTVRTCPNCSGNGQRGN